jgi:hypothetical protein
MTINPSIKNALLFFAVGLVFGLFLSFLWEQMLIPKYTPPLSTESPKKLAKEVTNFETVYTKKADSINGESQKLKTELSNTKTALTEATERTADLNKQIFTLLDERFAKMQEAKSDIGCDSLANVVPVLIAASEEKDSLYNSALVNLQSQVQNRDSAVTLQDQEYADLKASFTKSIEAQTFLTSDNKALTKTIRQQRTKSKLLSAALFILSGAAATYLLHH